MGLDYGADKNKRFDSEKESVSDDEVEEDFPNKLPPAKELMSLTSFDKIQKVKIGEGAEKFKYVVIHIRNSITDETLTIVRGLGSKDEEYHNNIFEKFK